MFKPGDIVRKISGIPFSNGRLESTVSHTKINGLDSKYNAVYSLETGLYMDQCKLRLVKAAIEYDDEAII